MSSEEKNAPLPPSTKANEPATSSQAVLNAHTIAITGGEFNQVNGHQISVAVNINDNRHLTVNKDSTSASTSKTPASPSAPVPSNETDRINPSPPSGGQSTDLSNVRNQPQVPSQNQEIPLQQNQDIYSRNLMQKGRGFPLWIPEPNRRLCIVYRRTGIRIGDVGIINRSGGFSFLFNICLPRDDPVNARKLPEHFAPISPPIDYDDDIDEFPVFPNDSHVASASITRLQSNSDFSRIVFESSASEGAILTMPQGARSEDLGNVARFRDYLTANVADWYKFVNGVCGREAKNGDIRLVVGFDKTKCWGIATFVNQTIQKNTLKFGPLEGTGSATYRWEYSGVVEAKIGPASTQNELKMASDPLDVQFENQSPFIRTLNPTLPDAVWKDLNSNLGSVRADLANDQSHHHSNPNHPHPSHSGNSNGSNSSAPQGGQYGTQRTECCVQELQDVDVTSDDNLISGPLESFTAHPSRVLNDILLAKNPTAKMVITHDNDWSSLINENGTLPDSHDLIANNLAPRVREENGVVFLQPLPRKGRPNDTSEPTSAVSPVQAVYESKATADLAETKAPFTKYNVGRTIRPRHNSSASVLTLPQYSSHPPRSHWKEAPPLYTSTLVEEPTSIDLPSKSDIIIAVMGPTGVGKSTFINKAAGFEAVEVGHGLQSCTNRVQIVSRVDKQNRRVVFVDTPGFDDTNISDLDILQLVADWLKLTYEKGICLSGLLFFHRISDNRMAGSPLKHLKMFQNLCGKEALKNVMLVTTMWDDVEESEGRNREIELSTKYWNDMLQLGSRTTRFDNDTESAWKIISQFQEAPCAVLLQKELVDQGLKLAETAAGGTLFSFLVDFIKQIKENLAQIEVKLKQNQHSEDRIVIEIKKTVEAKKLRDANKQRWRYFVPSRYGRSQAH